MVAPTATGVSVVSAAVDDFAPNALHPLSAKAPRMAIADRDIAFRRIVVFIKKSSFKSEIYS
jgi:hypothetical protein